MAITVTPEAAEMLRRSLELAASGPDAAGIRLRMARALGGGVSAQVELAEGPAPGEEVVETGGLRLFVDPSLEEHIPDPVVTLEPQHERVVVRPSG